MTSADANRRTTPHTCGARARCDAFGDAHVARHLLLPPTPPTARTQHACCAAALSTGTHATNERFSTLTPALTTGIRCTMPRPTLYHTLPAHTTRLHLCPHYFTYPTFLPCTHLLPAPHKQLLRSRSTARTHTHDASHTNRTHTFWFRCSDDHYCVLKPALSCCHCSKRRDARATAHRLFLLPQGAREGPRRARRTSYLPPLPLPTCYTRARPTAA